MQHDEFIGRVQHRAQLPSRGDTERVVRTILELLGERLTAAGSSHLAAQLPSELGRHLIGRPEGPKLHLEQFIDRVAQRERIPVEDARRHVHAVLGTVAESVSFGALEHTRGQLPKEFGSLFSTTLIEDEKRMNLPESRL